MEPAPEDRAVNTTALGISDQNRRWTSKPILVNRGGIERQLHDFERESGEGLLSRMVGCSTRVWEQGWGTENSDQARGTAGQVSCCPRCVRGLGRGPKARTREWSREMG
jgi:hypothetical protein